MPEISKNPGPFERLSRTPEFDRYREEVRTLLDSERISKFREAESHASKGKDDLAHVSLIQAGQTRAIASKLNALLLALIAKEQGKPIPGSSPASTESTPGSEPGYRGV
jgi:hypothetical protein